MPESSRDPKRRLGRGLSSLISSSIATEAETPAEGAYESSGEPARPASSGEPFHLAVSDIAPNPFQPRRSFNEDALRELTESIAQQGVLQPLIVVASAAEDAPAPYLLVAGERRLRAARQAGLTEVPCIVRQASRQEMLEWAIVENIQRADLNPLERAQAYREYIDRFGLTQVEAAQRLGQARPTIANHLRILDLSDVAQQYVADGSLSFGHAKVLASVSDLSRQEELAVRCVQEGWNVRRLESETGKGQPADSAAKDASTKPAKPAYVRDLEERLTQAVGTRVRIQQGRGKHTGRIVVDYYGLDDFERIAGCLGLGIEE